MGTISGATVGSVFGTSEIRDVSLAPGRNGVQYNFCELPPAEISGFVFEDLNDDGVRQSGETLIAGAKVDLYDSSGQFIRSTTTNAAGFYSFTSLGPGVYELRETTPAGYIDGKDIVGTINGQKVGTLGNDQIKSIDLKAGFQGINYDFGELRPGSLSGRVIVDINNNNLIDRPIEKPIAGVTIQLLDAAGNVLQTTTTDANGDYLFSNLRPGQYSVREIQPTDYLNGATYAGSHGGDTSTSDLIRGFAIASGDDLFDYDFTEIPPAQISGMSLSIAMAIA